MSPQFNIKVLGVGIRDLVFVHQHSGTVGDISPIVFTEWKFGKSSEFEDDGVPDGVEVVCTRFVWKGNEVTAKITSQVVFVNSRGGMQWLVYITDIVDQESHSIGKTVRFRMIFVCVFHDRLVLVSFLVSVGLVEPLVQGFDNFSDIVCVVCEVEVADFTSLIEEWLINKMPSFLPLASLGFNLIGKGSAFNHWMLVL